MKKLFCLLLCLLVLCGCTNNNANTDTDTTTAIDMSTVSSIADLKGAKIAVQTDLHEELAKQVEDVEYQFYDNLDMSVTAVKTGIMDCAIMDQPIAYVYTMKDDSLAYVDFTNNVNGFTVSEADYANSAAFKKGNELRDEVEAIITSVDMDTYHELMNQILVVSNGGELENGFVLEYEEPTNPDGVLRVGMECASEPFNWTDIDGASFGSVTIASGEGAGQPCNGLDVQVAKYVAAKLNKTLEVYAIEWDSLLPALDAGTIDCIIGNMSPREDRKVNYDFTSSYYDVDYVVLYNK